ncbi:hypothetical protein DPMN_082932 [Dreissena polymorpha]|uniref:Uncharacterized protein n=1 Tax=Dreissena polymorpha TaxID=45954 RepID=A0A9D3Y8Z9_DREPO|nr:hypothetical protein DPMN_082932 [Dreissena polymorpha]
MDEYCLVFQARTLTIWTSIAWYFRLVPSLYGRVLPGISDSYPHYMDEYCLVLLLKGVCQKFRGQFLQAEQCFLEIIAK